MVWFNRQQQHHRELTQWYCSNNKQLRKRPPYNRSQPKTYPPTVLFFISEYKSVFSLGIRSQIRFLGARKTSCWNINLQRASQEANGGSRSGQKNGSRPQLHQCGKYFQKVFLVIRKITWIFKFKVEFDFLFLFTSPMTHSDSQQETERVVGYVNKNVFCRWQQPLTIWQKQNFVTNIWFIINKNMIIISHTIILR